MGSPPPLCPLTLTPLQATDVVGQLAQRQGLSPFTVSEEGAGREGGGCGLPSRDPERLGLFRRLVSWLVCIWQVF